MTFYRTILALAVFSLAAPPATAAPPPAGRTYFITTLGAGGPMDLDAGCLRFMATRVCLDTVDPTDPLFCGTWELTDDLSSEERGVAIDIDWDTGAVTLGVDGHLRIDSRGKGSSIGGVARLAADDIGAESNLSLAGTQAKRRECRRLAREYKELSYQWTAMQCVRRARFVAPANAPFVLPFPVGDAYPLGQAYCDSRGSHRDSFAYDFNMPIGSPVAAAAAGVVWLVQDEYEDGDLAPEHSNTLFIEHADGRVTQYAHLQHGSFLVRVGERVTAGQTIAASGDTGIVYGSPHLHFELYRSTASFDSLPVSFRNAGGPTDERGGLVWGETYEALAW